jgi:hypothetical protein
MGGLSCERGERREKWRGRVEGEGEGMETKERTEGVQKQKAFKKTW